MNEEFDVRFGIIPKILIKTPAYHDFQFQDGTVTFIRGFRGTGKTVLLNYLRRHLPAGWVAGFATNGPRLIHNLSTSLYTQLKGRQLINDFQHYVDMIKVDKFSGKFRDGLDFDNFNVLANLMSYWLHYKHLVLFIDEANNTKDLLSLLSQFSDFQQDGYAISLVISGVDNEIDELKHTKGFTFLTRAFEVQMTQLDTSAMAGAYAKAFHCELGDGYMLANTCSGIAYGFQVMGRLVSQSLENHQSSNVSQALKAVLPAFKNELYQHVYVNIFSDLKHNEQLTLIGLAQAIVNHWSLIELAQKLNMRKQNLYFYLQALVYHGLLKSISRGHYSFSLSFFGDFVQNVTNVSSGAYIADASLLISEINI